jgi:hypothetical protein
MVVGHSIPHGNQPMSQLHHRSLWIIRQMVVGHSISHGNQPMSQLHHDQEGTPLDSPRLLHRLETNTPILVAFKIADGLEHNLRLG